MPDLQVVTLIFKKKNKIFDHIFNFFNILSIYIYVDSVTSCRMGGVQPRLCYTISFESTEDIVDDFVHFQFITRFINLQNQW